MGKVSLLGVHTNHITCAPHCFMRSGILYLLIILCVYVCGCVRAYVCACAQESWLADWWHLQSH